MRLKNPPWQRRGIKVTLGTALLLGAQTAFGATITVDSSADDVTDDTSCTLREAISAMNGGADDNGCVADVTADGYGNNDTINFDASVTSILLTAGVMGDMPITTPLVIDGGGLVTIDANADDNVFGDRIFDIQAESTLSGLTLTNGSVDAGNGGAVLASAMLTVTDSVFTNNEATGAGASGGAIASSANLSVSGSSFSGNFANRAGGAIEVSDGFTGEVDIAMSDFDGNSTGDAMNGPGNGGAFHITDPDGTVSTMVTGGNFTNNSAFNEGGALWNHAGIMTIDGVTITGNSASGVNSNNGGGGLFNNGGTMNVNSVAGATLIDNNEANGTAGSGGGIFNNSLENSAGVLNVDVVDSTTLGVTISNNRAPRAGGGIETLGGEVTLVGVVLSGNSTGDVPTDDPMSPVVAAPGNGGGLHISGAGNLFLDSTEGDTVRRSTVSGNSAAREGGGLWVNSGNAIVRGSDISGNTAAGDGAANGGGGIFHNAGNTPGDMDATGGSLSLFDVTVTGNTATGDLGSGGGIFVNAGGSLNAAASVIAGNTANRAGGGIETRSSVEGSASASLTGVSLTGNTAAGNTEVEGSPGNGGGLHVSGGGASTTISLSLITDNVAASEGGGLWNFSDSTMNVQTSSILRNVASGAAADNGGGGIFENGGTTFVSNSRILLNNATGASGSGGGIFVNTGGTMDIANSTIAGNTANRAGGGIENNAGEVRLFRVNLGGTDAGSGNIAGTSPGNGGGLHTTGAGNVAVEESLVGYNTASEGGGLWNSPAGVMLVANSSVSNNQASGDGGGVYQEGDSGSGVTEVVFSTVTANAAGGIGGGLGTGETSPLLTVEASLVAENSDASADGATNDASTSVVFVGSDEMNLSGNNLIGANGGFDGGLRLYGPALFDGWMGGSLPTAVHPLLAEAEAVDAATSCDVSVDGVTETAENDQRQVMRTQVDGCDLGSYEAADIPVLDVTTTNGAAVTVTEASDEVVLFGVQVSNSGVGDVDLGGFAGAINVNNLPAGVDLTALTQVEVELYEDTNGDGVFQSDSDTFVSDVELDVFGTLRFAATLPAAETLTGSDTNTPEEASRSYIAVANLVEDMMSPVEEAPEENIVPDLESILSQGSGEGLSWRTPALAGGAFLGLLSLFSVGRIRRRTRLALLVGASAVILTACGGGGGGGSDGAVPVPPGPGPGPGPAPNPLTAGDVQFVVDTLLGDSMATDNQVIGDGLPVNGPAITITGLPAVSQQPESAPAG